MSDVCLRVEIDGSVAVLILNRPERRNALTPRLLARLGTELQRLEEDPKLRCVVLTGSGGTFCSGMDLDELPTEPAVIEACGAMVDTLAGFPLPTIALVRGHCLAGGLELALACDLVVAADDAVFADRHALLGLVPVFGLSVRLPERVGVARAKELIFTGRSVDAVEAERIGLAQHVIPTSEADQFVGQLCAEIAAGNRDSTVIVKRMLAGHRLPERDEALRRERSLNHGVPITGTARPAAVSR